MTDTITPAMQEQIEATISLIDGDLVGHDLLENRLTNLVHTCIAYATEKPQKRIVSFAGTSPSDPATMIDRVNAKANHWLENGGVIIRDPQIIPHSDMAICANDQGVYTVYKYTVSIIFTEDVSGIPDEEPDNGGC